MDIRPLPGTTGARLIELLTAAEQGLRNVEGRGGSSIDRFNAYLTWSSDQVRMLGPALYQNGLDLLVTTRRHWALYNLDPTSKGPTLNGLVDAEIGQQLRVLVAARKQLAEQSREYATVDRILVPDTNVFLHANAVFDQLDWSLVDDARYPESRVVVLLPVIDELDRAKRLGGRFVHGKSGEQVPTRARKSLDALEAILLPPQKTERRKLVSFGAHLERPDHVRLADTDHEIIDQARGLRDQLGIALSILTLDTGMRFRAELAGLHITDVPEKWLFADESTG